MQQNRLFDLIKRIKALADTGLVYAKDDYDTERYEELRNIGIELLAQLSDRPAEVLHDFFLPEKDYPTVKVDVRGLVMNEKDEILMTRESADNKWTIPGGWADIGDTPSAAIIKEIKEETGLDAESVRILALYDKSRHPHPPQPFYVYKLIFLCRITGGTLKPGFDINEVSYFPVTQLPTLSKDRILKSQIEQLVGLAMDKSRDVYFD